MKKNLLIGCSNGMSFLDSFPKVFDDKNIKWFNKSWSAMGNIYISSMLFEFIEEFGMPDYVYFQFSGLSRIDIPFDRNIQVPDYSFQRKTRYKNWVASGGHDGSWPHNDLTKKIFCYLYDLKNEKTNHDISFKNIFAAIELCKTLKIKYNWTFYYDIFDPPKDSNAYKLDGKIEKFPDYIDTGNFLGVYPLNFAYEINEPPEDGIHFSTGSFLKFLVTYKDKFNI
jgi:hypothetical protein